jgi:hypothetical protein
MLLDSVRRLLRLHAAAPVEPQAAPEPQPILSPEISLAEDDDPIWPRARIAVAEALWGEGFLLPGGGEEVVRLAKPLGLSAASSAVADPNFRPGHDAPTLPPGSFRSPRRPAVDLPHSLSPRPQARR